MTLVGAMMSALGARLRAVFRRGALEREMHEEMSAHLEQAAERLKRRGLSDAAAREAARREFGNVAYLQEEARDVRGGRWVESLLGDVRFALRHFARTPLTAVTLVLVLSLGIGVNSALFSILQALTMRPPPGIEAADALVRVRGSTLSRSEGRLEPRELSLPELNAIAAHRETFAAVAGFAWDQVVLDAGDGSDLRPISGYFVTPNFFPTLGIRPAIGPGLPVGRTDDAPGSELAVVISHPLWEQLGGDTALVGRVLRLNDVPVRVAGVAPPRFYGVEMSDLRGFFMPLDARAAITRSTPHALASRDSALFQAVARLTPGTSVERATAVARVVAASWAPEVPRSGDVKEHSTDVVPLRGFTDVGSDGEALAIIALFGTGGLLVLLITCTNVSALLVGAGVARRREFAIRLSLGASRRRVIRQLVTETSIIALAGGALGLALYWWITRIVAWLVGDIGITPDLGTVGFTTAIALGTGIVFGLSPALHATRLDVATALKDASAGATSRTRLQRVFILAQIALTQPLLVGVAMVIGITLLETGRGRDEPLAARLIRVEFGMEGGVGSRESKAERIREVMDRVATLPGVEGVVPQAAGLATGQFRVHASNRGGGPRAEEMVQATIEGTAPGYFALQGIPMLRGRELMPTDTASGGDMAVVIDSDLARGFWGATDPIGKRMDVTSRQFADDPRTAVVVGVFDTARVTARGPDRVYTAAGAGWRKNAYLVRTQVQGTTVIPAIRQLARAEIPDIPIYNRGLLTLEQLTRIERNEILQISAGVSGGGALALLLASIGLYGVVALAVRQRQREIGIRVALGARPRQVVGMFLSSGVRLSAIGIVLGLPLSVVAVRFLVLSLADVETIPLNMPLVGAAIAVVVVAVASLASWIPARKAARVDPILTLKTE